MNNFQMPNAGLANVDDDKIKNYLLNTAHPDGGSKARFFISMGLNETLLKTILIQHAMLNYTTIEETPYGNKYIIEGKTNTIKPFLLRSVWIIKTNEKTPDLITAYPI